jgi:hypothetical protein
MVGMARPADEVAGGTIPAYVNPAGGSAKAAKEGPKGRWLTAGEWAALKRL